MKKMSNDYKTPKKFLKSLLVIFFILFTITLFISMVSCSQEATIKHLISNLDNKNTEVQKDSIEQLTGIGKPAIPYLHEAIKNDNQLIKENIIVILGNIKDPSSLGPLFNVLSSDNELVRENAVTAIRKIGVEDISFWIEALNNTHEDVQLVAISKLRGSKNDAAVEPLLNMLNSSNEKVIYNTVEALGVFKDPRAVDKLIEALGTWSDNSDIVLKSIEALSVINDDKAVLPLIDLLNSKDLTIISSTIKALGGFKDPRAVDKLIEVLYTWSDNFDITDQIIAALISIGKPAVEPLIPWLKNADPFTKEIACYILGEIGDVSAVEPLLEALNDEDFNVRFSAGMALNRLETTPEIESLIKAMQEENLKIVAKYYVFYILRGESSTEPILISALDKYGDVTMAEDFLNCGNNQLETGAEKWAERNGYEVVTRFGGNASPQWGAGE